MSKLKGKNLHTFIKEIRRNLNNRELHNCSEYLRAELYGFVNGMWFANMITFSSMNRLKRYIKKEMDLCIKEVHNG